MLSNKAYGNNIEKNIKQSQWIVLKHTNRDTYQQKNTDTQTEKFPIKLEMHSQHIDVTLTPRKTTSWYNSQEGSLIAPTLSDTFQLEAQCGQWQGKQGVKDANWLRN